MIAMFGHCSRMSEVMERWYNHELHKVVHCTIKGINTDYDGSMVVEADATNAEAAGLREGWCGTITARPQVLSYNGKDYTVIRMVTAVECVPMKGENWKL